MSRTLNDFKPPEYSYQISEDEDRYLERVLEDALDERMMEGRNVVFKPELLDGFIDADKSV